MTMSEGWYVIHSQELLESMQRVERGELTATEALSLINEHSDIESYEGGESDE